MCAPPPAIRSSIRSRPPTPAPSLPTASSSRARSARWLEALRARDIPAIARRYREDYQSRLFRPRELAGWLRVAARRARHLRAPADGWPLEFPNRVTVELAGGRRETAFLSRPVGALTNPDVERELAAKFFRCAEPALGAPRAEDALRRGLALGGESLAAFLRSAAGGPP